jgi:hypothetical protein
MLETKRRPPRAPEDRRMNLYHDSFRGRLRWYVKISKKGRRIDITDEYSTDERSDFHQAWEAAVRALALQLPFPKISESMVNHDSKIVGAGSVD